MPALPAALAYGKQIPSPLKVTVSGWLWTPSETEIVTVVPCGLSVLDGVTVKVVVPEPVPVTVARLALDDVAVKVPKNPVSLAVNVCGAFALEHPVFSCGL
jgi:hypothetical protein